MALQKEALSIEAADPETVLPFVAMAAAYDTTGGKATAQDVARFGGFVVHRHGRRAAGFTLAFSGDECEVTAAGSIDPAIDLAGLIDQIACAVPGVRRVTFHTRRPALMRKAARLGYRPIGAAENGTIMQKENHV